MLIFDTLTYTQRLTDAGMPEKHAKAAAEGLRDLLLANLATKDDIAVLRAELKGTIKTHMLMTVGLTVSILYTLLRLT